MSYFKVIVINVLLSVVLIYFVIFFFSTFRKNSTSYQSVNVNHELLYKKPLRLEVPKQLFRSIDKKLIGLLGFDHSEYKFAKEYFDAYLNKAGTFPSVARLRGSHQIVYEVDYILNEFGVRQVESAADKTKAKKFVAAFGGSNTFGEGLPQGQDYPSQLNALLPADWSVYNFGFHGFGPNSVISNIVNKQSPYKKIIKQESGVFVWLFNPDHLLRFFCYFDCYAQKNIWILTLPEVSFVDGKYFSVSDYASSKYFWRKAASFLSKYFDFSNFGSYNYGDSDMREFIAALNFIASSSSEKIEKKIFIFDYFYREFDSARFMELLAEEGYLLVNLNKYTNIVPAEQLKITGDGHNSAVTNWIIASVLSSLIQESH